MEKIDLPQQISWEISLKHKDRVINAYRAPWWRKVYWVYRLWQIRWNRWRSK